ncbi:MAG: hypothetical protein BWK78_05115 [Thiotrichaceae bacterium IS1]|nr:MAG: hypothetical protein BWK78_05115 [Thiotrichaceae bacterium IS1]
MTEDKLKQSIHQEIERATVKILLNSIFMGTGFFITPDGYVLTAFHCIGEKADIKEGFVERIQIELVPEKFFDAQLDYVKSAPDNDIAVLKVNYSSEHYLPLSLISTEETDRYRDSRVVALGYPAGRRYESIGIYSGEITRFSDDNKIEINKVVKGTGQSGSVLYHYETQRVIGVVVEVVEIDKPNEVTHIELAVRFESLFKTWPELQKITDDVAKDWDKYLEQLGVTTPSEKVQNQGVANVTQTVHNHGETNKQVIIGHVDTLNIND